MAESRNVRGGERSLEQSTDDYFGRHYRQLGNMAARLTAREAHGSPIDAHDLLHEVYLRVRKSRPIPWSSATHFVAVIRLTMKHYLVEEGRRKRCLKRGGHKSRIELGFGSATTAPSRDECIDLGEALALLAILDPDKADLVRLRFYDGLSMTAVASLLGISRATVCRRWAETRRWLQSEMRR